MKTRINPINRKPIRLSFDEVQQLFQKSKGMVIEGRMKNFENFALKDYDNDRMDRRAVAIYSTWSELEHRLYPLLKAFHYKDDEIATKWVVLNLCSDCALDVKEKAFGLNRAAGQWIYDCIAESEQENALRAIIQDLGDDPAEAICFILDHRNDDCVGEQRIEFTDDMSRPLMDIYTCKNSQHQNCPSRNRFEAVLALLPEETLNEAKESYTEVYWIWMEKFFQCLIFEEYYRFMGSAVLGHCAESVYDIMDSEDGEDLGALDETEIASVAEWLSSKAEQWGEDISGILGLMILAEGTTEFYQSNPENNRVWDDFIIEDPAILAAGQLLLLDDGSDLPWVPVAGSGMYHAIAAAMGL